MRHAKHNHVLGVKKEHRFAMMALLAQAILLHGRIQTTLAKAKALRPFIEKIITLAKKAQAVEDKATKLHYIRLALAKVRDRQAVRKLFNERVKEFENRSGGYTRIYKLWQRTGDAAEMALIELVPANDTGYKKPSRSSVQTRKIKTATPKAVIQEPSSQPVVSKVEPVDPITEAP